MLYCWWYFYQSVKVLSTSLLYYKAINFPFIVNILGHILWNYENSYSSTFAHYFFFKFSSVRWAPNDRHLLVQGWYMWQMWLFMPLPRLGCKRHWEKISFKQYWGFHLGYICVCSDSPSLRSLILRKSVAVLLSALWRGPNGKKLKFPANRHASEFESRSYSPSHASDDCGPGWDFHCSLVRLGARITQESYSWSPGPQTMM